MKRKTSEEERKLFQHPYRRSDPEAQTGETSGAKNQPKPKPAELDGNTAEKLRRGQLAPGARIDLHGMTGSGGASRAAFLSCPRPG